MVFGLKLGLPKKGLVAADPSTRCESGAVKTPGDGTSGKSALTVNEFVSRTKKCREKGLEPSKPELIAYARYLGIDPIADGDLMWIADEALNAPLPAEWTEHHDSADRVFYYNVHTHASAWTHPLEQVHRDTYNKIVSFRSGDIPKDQQVAELEELRRESEQQERAAHKELQSWTEHTDDQGQNFFYNKELKRSVWTDPRPARCHTLYLQMKAVRVLSKHCGQGDHLPGELGKNRLGNHEGSPMEREKVGTRQKIEQSLAFGTSDDELISSKDASLHVESKEEKKKRKKKHKDRDRLREEGNDARELSPIAQPRASEASDDMGIPSLMSRKSLDMRKPGISAVEEVRHALGVGNTLPCLHSSGCHSMSRLPDLDGLSNVGRSRIKPGIRLEPIEHLD